MPGRDRAALGLCAALATAVLLSASAHADGSLPAQPYNYLHPPPALTGSNRLPSSGRVTFDVSRGTVAAGHAFTRDGQAGIIATAGTFSAQAGAGGVQITVNPVEAPSGLPSALVVDGNAYRIDATTVPSGTPATMHGRVTLVLRWPHIPTAIYRYNQGAWTRVCTSDKAILTPTTISCTTTMLGTFAAVTFPSQSGSPSPTVPGVSSSPYAGLLRYIPIAAAALVFILAIVVGYFVSRPNRGT
jgi:hypothetical protein